MQYPWHPLHGQDVVVHGIKRGARTVLRCNVEADGRQENREVPAVDPACHPEDQELHSLGTIAATWYCCPAGDPPGPASSNDKPEMPRIPP